MNSNRISFSTILSALDFYDNALKGLKYDPQEPRSAIAIIVKTTKQKQNNNYQSTFQHDQILFLQRKKSPKDKFSGQICFPGGKQQKNQTLFTTVLRQTFQQTNIQLQQKYFIGCLNRKINLILSTKKKNQNRNLNNSDKGSNVSFQKQMSVYAFVFMINEQMIDRQTIRLNKDEMEGYNWVKTDLLMNPGNICWFDYSQRIKGVIKHQNINSIKNKQEVKMIQKYAKRVLSVALDIGMDEKLYGISLYITLTLLVSILKKLQILQHQLSSGSFIGDQLPQSSFIGDQLPQSSFIEDKRSIKYLINSLTEIKQRCQYHVVFQIQQPIDLNFVTFQKQLLTGIYSLRPKL